MGWSSHLGKLKAWWKSPITARKIRLTCIVLFVLLFAPRRSEMPAPFVVIATRSQGHGVVLYGSVGDVSGDTNLESP
ncbi:uncharacterized protein K452DRAFT_286216 [Aplosporella prunicola CBS 121167]|uniref:Uncharacterized protein n=1 Tax=Aplosporella prunicola CBS 121167 TaxID=1176127 RepID=A0A6A6BID6_9PEZI|nr:uncharacterized protein K452DRAFT_286216 [Aplosporella prunicola CBS 121167]KAF2143388.1 hypothetical protein K452DRAFT_286216 [Aplosporella prunicola CBS 121167]